MNASAPEPRTSLKPGDVLLVMGVAGTGKTEIANRLADALGGVFLEGDDLHNARNVAAMSRGIPLTDEDRWPWLEAICDHAGRQTRKPVVIACSALKRSYRDFIRQRLGAVTLFHLMGTPALISERLRNRRGHFATVSLHESQMLTLEPPTADEEPINLDIAASPEEIVFAAIVEIGARAL